MSDAINKKTGHRWPKGISGNPSGRPRGHTEVRVLARSHGPAAIKRLRELMDSNDLPVAVSAAKALLDRGWGKPSQQITGPDGGALVNIVLNSGNAIVDAGDAARIYAEICGNPGLDISALKFAPPEAPALEHVASSTIEAAPVNPSPVHQDDQEDDAPDRSLKIWEDLAE